MYKKNDLVYLHIGNDVSVNVKNIVGIFDINTLKKSEEFDNLMERLDKNIIDISEGKRKSLIIIIENNMKKAYISNILSTTLEKRAKNRFA